MSAVAESTRTGTPPATPPDDSALARAGAWARRAPLLPALIFMIIITQLPFLVTLGISFMNWNAYYPDEIGFNGLDNYRRVLTDANTRSAIVVTVILTVSVVLISLLLDRQFRGRGVVRTMMITPFLIVPVAAALLWKHALFNPEYGLFNGVLRWVGNLFGQTWPQPDWISQAPLWAIIAPENQP